MEEFIDGLELDEIANDIRGLAATPILNAQGKLTATGKAFANRIQTQAKQRWQATRPTPAPAMQGGGACGCGTGGKLWEQYDIYDQVVLLNLNTTGAPLPANFQGSLERDFAVGYERVIGFGLVMIDAVPAGEDFLIGLKTNRKIYFEPSHWRFNAFDERTPVNERYRDVTIPTSESRFSLDLVFPNGLTPVTLRTAIHLRLIRKRQC